MFIVYVLKSKTSGRFYVGQTNNLVKRLDYHNSGRTRSGRNRGPWEIAYTEEFATRSEAVRREKQIKKWKSHRYLQQLIERNRSNLPNI